MVGAAIGTDSKTMLNFKLLRKFLSLSTYDFQNISDDKICGETDCRTAIKSFYR